MNPRSFYKLSIATAIAFIAAVCSWVLVPDHSVGSFFGEPLFPDLINRLNEIEVISIEHKNQNLTFTRDSNKEWILMENNYPVDKERIRNTLIGLSRLEKIEPKTALPEFYPDLQVEDISAKEANSYLLTLLNIDGQPLTSIIIGKSVNGITWNGQGYFVRFPNEAQSWLVRGNFDITGDAYSWLMTRILPLSAGKISSVTLTNDAQKREITYTRPAPSYPLLSSSVSDDFFQTSPEFTSKMEKALLSFTFEDVFPLPSPVSQKTPATSIKIETQDGLKIHLSLFFEEGIPYVTVSFAATEKAKDTVKKEAERLERLHQKWLYKIPAETASALQPFKAVSAPVLEEKKEEEPKKQPVPSAPKPSPKKKSHSKK